MFGGTLLLEKPQILNFILSASPNVHTYLLTRQCILCKEAPLCNMEFYIVPSGDEIGHRLSILRKQWKERVEEKTRKDGNVMWQLPKYVCTQYMECSESIWR